MLDAYAMFDNKADLTTAQFGSGAAGTYTSTSSYDTAAAGVPAAVGPSGGTIGGPLLHDFGRGRRLNFYAQITTAVTSAGAATLEVDFISSAAAALSAATTLLLTPAIAKATLVAGYRFRHGTTPGVIAQRYVGAQYVIGTATITAGNISSGLMTDPDDHADVLG